MLSMTTEKHKVFVTIVGIQGGGQESFAGLARAIDEAVDRLHAKCKADGKVVEALQGASSREQAYRVIATHLEAATPDAKWLRNAASSDLCRRVLYLMHPDRFNFERYGWIH